MEDTGELELRKEGERKTDSDVQTRLGHRTTNGLEEGVRGENSG